MAVHDKVRAYACDFCDKKIAQKYDMTKHIQRHHTNGPNVNGSPSLNKWSVKEYTGWVIQRWKVVSREVDIQKIYV